MKVITKSPLESPRWPWPKMDKEEVARNLLNNKVYMPNIGYIQLPNLCEWDLDLGDAPNSKLLWINSLVSAHCCLIEGREKNDPELVNTAYKFLESYLQFYDCNMGFLKDAWKDEHAVSNRLFALTAFLHDSCIFDPPTSQVLLLQHAERHVEWLLNDSKYIWNNHGVMMDFALLQFGVFIQSVESNFSHKCIETASRRLQKMFEMTFDSDGYCTENSPSYHFVNYSLFKSILDYSKQYKILEDVISEWNEILHRAQRVGCLLIRSNRTIPTIGDSEEKLGTFFPDNNEVSCSSGIGFYPEGGLFVAKLPNLHFTFRAGGKTFSHRHVDDLSITLFYKEKNFIVDSGLYNYDISDKKRRWFISSRAHSGCYLASEGHVLFKNFEKPNSMSRFLSNKNDGSNFEILASHNLSDDTEVRRKVSFFKSCLTIEDSFVSQENESWRSQYVLHPDVEIYQCSEEKAFRLINGGRIMTLQFFGKIEEIKIENSQYSNYFMQSIPNKTIVASGKANNLNLICVLKLD